MDRTGDLVSSLHDHLEATEEHPLETEPNRILGEAQAIAEDLTEADLDTERIEERVEQILDLLDELDGTGDETADEHVAAARRAAQRIVEG
jgi:hypothetical protein